VGWPGQPHASGLTYLTAGRSNRGFTEVAPQGPPFMVPGINHPLGSPSQWTLITTTKLVAKEGSSFDDAHGRDDFGRRPGC